MAQIIKHRRGLIGGVKSLTARNGELIIASGSISDLSGPFVFIGSPNVVDEGVAGAFNTVSKLYTGTAAPTITAATYGSALDGTPYYASGNKSLYILNNSNVGNSKIDLTGNIEDNTISGVTINNLQSTNITASFVSASFVGDATGLYNIPATGVTGLNLSKIYSGSVQVTTDSVSGDIHIEADNSIIVTGTSFNVTSYGTEIKGIGTTKVGQSTNNGYFYTSDYYAEMYGQTGIDIHTNTGNLSVYNNSGAVNVSSYDGGTLNLNSDGGEGDVNVLNGTNKININGNSNFTGSVNVSGNTSVTGSLVVSNGAAFIDQGVVSQNSNVLLTSGSNLIIQDGGNLQVAGDATITGSLYVSGNIYQTGSYFTQGNITLSGSINLGDSLTGDTINFGGEVNSNILPTTGATYDLGSSGQTWNNVWAETAHFGNISLNTISFSGLTEGRVLLAGPEGSIVDSGSFTYGYNGDYGDYTLEAPIIRASNDGNGTNFLIGNDMWLGDVNEANATRFMGTDNNSLAKIYLGSNSTNNYLQVDYGDVTLQSNDRLYLKSQNSSVDINAYGGNLNLNTDSNNDISIGGNTYLDTNKELFASYIRDNNNNWNYLQLYGYGTDDNFWWESGNGADTTLLNNENNNNLNILQKNNGNVNIDATGGSVNLHSNNGFNVTGSLVVSDASGVFNSSLISYNSDLTLTGGSNINMEDNANLYFNSQNAKIYFNTGNNELTLYNDANNSIVLDNRVNVTDNLYVSGSEYVDDIISRNGNSTNALHLNGGYFVPEVELASVGQISLFSEGANNTSDYAINMTGSVHMKDSADISGSLIVLNNVTASYFTGSFVGDGSNLTGVPMSGVTGLDFSKIYSGSVSASISPNLGFQVNTSSYFIGNVQVTGSFKLNDVSSSFNIVGNGFGQTSLQSPDGALILQGGYGGVQINGANSNLLVEGNITGNQNLQISGNTSLTGSLTVASGSATMLGGDLYVSGNLQVLGSSTNVNIESSTVNIGDNIIQVNAYSPFDRYAGLAAYDSGSSGASGSFLWDSTNDYWLIVNANSYSSKVIGTTASTGSTGTEISLTSGTFPIASASNTIEDSLLTYSGTTLAYNVNKFTVDSGTGDTAISGNLTLSYSGGTDNGTKSSAVTFRNSSNVLGFVSTTETTNELDGILGYNHLSGVLEFSTLIDGGTY